MNPTRKQSIITNLQSSLKKVFGCVPMIEAWNANQIAHELKRTHQSIGRSSVIGCLNSLKSLKIVVETKPGYFKQVECRIVKKKTNLFDTNEQVKEDENPIEALQKLIKNLDTIKTELEITVLDVEEYMKKAEQKVVKLTQLQELLKGIND